MDSCSRAAALPVGVASAMRRGPASPASKNSATKRAASRVLPVPGPPVTMARRRVAANSAAARASPASGNKRRNGASKPANDSRSSPLSAKRRKRSASWRSASQRRRR